MINRKQLNKILILLSLVIVILGNLKAQRNLIHNFDNNSFVDFSEILEEFTLLGRTGIDKTKNTTKETVFNITLHNYGYLLLVEYLGEYRDIPKRKKTFMDASFKTIGAYDRMKNLFEKEVLVKGDTGNHWLPIQKELFKYWPKELSKGDSALIYIRVLGSIDDLPEKKWIFTINSFNSGFYDGLWEEAIANFENNNDTIGLRCVKKLISLNPKDGRNYAMMAYYYTRKGNNIYTRENIKLLNKADSLFTIAEELTPEYSYQYFQRAILKLYLEDYEKSWYYIEKAKSLNEQKIEQRFINDLEKKLPYQKYRLKNIKN